MSETCETRYVIAWRSKKTGFHHRGDSTYRLEEALDICDAANKEMPELHHWAEPDSDAPAKRGEGE